MKNIYTHHFYAMGSQIHLWLEFEDQSTAQFVLKQAETIFRTNEKRMTRFDSRSELSRLNREAGHWVKVSHTLWGVIECAIEMAWATNGLFDPTQLDALEAAGYNISFDLLNPSFEPFRKDIESKIAPSFREVELDRPGKRVKFPKGLRMDLGGIGKGFTAQEVTSYLGQFGPCLVDAGGDLTAGAAPTASPGWAVGIAAPWAGDGYQQNLLRLWLREGCLATSGVDYRRWVMGDVEAHHIIDPRSGEPAETDLLTVSILHADACTAEAWATAALVAGEQDGFEILLDHHLSAACINQHFQLSLTEQMQPLVQFEPTPASTGWISAYDSVQFS